MPWVKDLSYWQSSKTKTSRIKFFEQLAEITDEEIKQHVDNLHRNPGGKSELERVTTTTAKLVCQGCGNTWEYKGKNKYYASCSKCKTSVSIKKAKAQT